MGNFISKVISSLKVKQRIQYKDIINPKSTEGILLDTLSSDPEEYINILKKRFYIHISWIASSGILILLLIVIISIKCYQR